MQRIQLQPLPGHPLTIPASIVTRAPQDLKGIPSGFIDNHNSTSTNVQLMHAPTVIALEGGGEDLLNTESVLAQLSGYKKQKKQYSMPKSLITYLIKKQDISSDIRLILTFILGPLQRLHHQKKSSKSGPMLWEEAIKQIENEPHLKTCLESILFNGKKLSTQQYMLLLSGAKVGESSVGHAPGVQRQKRKTTVSSDNIKSKNKKSENNLNGRDNKCTVDEATSASTYEKTKATKPCHKNNAKKGAVNKNRDEAKCAKNSPHQLSMELGDHNG